MCILRLKIVSAHEVKLRAWHSQNYGYSLSKIEQALLAVWNWTADTVSGQPFDIVKVRLQTTSQYKNALDAATSIYKNEGATAFYKGTLTPLIGIGACVC